MLNIVKKLNSRGIHTSKRRSYDPHQYTLYKVILIVIIIVSCVTFYPLSIIFTICISIYLHTPMSKSMKCLY